MTYLPEEIQAMEEQIKMYHTELTSIQSSFLSMISVSFIGYGAVFYYCLIVNKSVTNLFFIVLPFLFSLSLFNIIKYTTKMLGLGAYIRYLEGELNAQSGKAVYKWYTYLVGANGFGFFGGLGQVPCILALGAFVVKKFIDAVYEPSIDPVARFFLIGALVLQLLMLAVMCIQCVVQHFAVESLSKSVGTDYHKSTSRMQLGTAISLYKEKKAKEKAAREAVKAKSDEEEPKKSKHQKHKENKIKGEMDAFSNRLGFTAGIGTIVMLIKDTIELISASINYFKPINADYMIYVDFASWFIVMVCLGVFCGTRILPDFFKKESVGRLGALLTVFSIILMLLENTVLKYSNDILTKLMFIVLFIFLILLSVYGFVALIIKAKKEKSK